MVQKEDSDFAWGTRFALIACIVFVSLVMLLLFSLDYLVNNDIHFVGQLQFSRVWYDPCDMCMLLAIAFSALSILASALVLVAGYVRKAMGSPGQQNSNSAKSFVRLLE